ncbi:MAG: PocR ligand-binding domain-containing protein [Spirochaetes bacterium]|nr:PocR ligand-binding domain-containing protein [Spirochaetota bacterium]
MVLKNKDLLFVLDVEKWQTLQDSLAVMTGMAIITVDFKGVPMTRHSHCSEFCKRVRAEPSLNMECQKCDSRGGLEATRMQKPYIYLCHANILDAAIPIIVNDNYLGAIMIGQVLLTEESDITQLEVMCASSRQRLEQMLGADMNLINQIPKLSFSRVKVIVDMLFHLCNYIVEEAIEKNMALEMCANVLNPTQINSNLAAYHAKNLKNVKRKLDAAIIESHIKQETEKEVEVNRILRPAIEYINEHKNESLPAKQLAALCNVSPGHFSKMFSREMGETYSSYLLRSRVKWAKELLKTSDKNINEIAFALGFSDAGHFIRSFKKYEGTTPANFRKFVLYNSKA